MTGKHDELVARLEAAEVALADALQAFDLLHGATCGKAPPDELSAHYGVRNAHQIMQAREQVNRLRATGASQ